jgi:GrpB-like predicted nucleotidyltransferase (UPF0157 family)
MMNVPIKSKSLQRLVDDLRAAHGNNLVSVTLYGSSAIDEADDRARHDVLIVLRRLELEDLRKATTTIRNWTRSGQPLPVYFSQDELDRAADVFPIEFLQMEQARKVLHGSDPFEWVEISNANLRHQTEYELRTKCQQLRRLYFSTADSGEKLTRLMIDSLSSFAALFRAVLILHGEPPPVSKRDTIKATIRVIGLASAPFDRILELSENKKLRQEGQQATALFGNYLAQLELVIDAVDRLERQ